MLNKSFIPFLLASLTASWAPAAERTWNVGTRKQLFIDRRFIERSENVTLRMNPAQKLGLVLDSTAAPWEDGTGHVLAVIDTGPKIRMYYGAYTHAGNAIAVVESEDGLHWVRPNLGLVEIGGNRNNNVLRCSQRDCPEVAHVYYDKRDVPARRYKLFITRGGENFDPKRDGVFAYTSADGIHFEEAGQVLPRYIDNPAIVNWDEKLGKYVVFTRAFIPGAENQRQIARIVTDDLLKPWPFRNTSDYWRATPDHLPVVLKADEDFTDLYYNNAVVYPWAEDVHLMFVTPFRHFAPNRQPWFRFKPGNDYGLIETQLAVSRDGIHWNRPDRTPYFPMGLANEWDRWLAVTGSGLLRRGNYLYQYYMSSGRTHDSAILRPEYDDAIKLKNGIGAVRQRLDGFMSADVDHNGGWLLTPPIVFGGNQLRLNIDTGATGTAFAEIRDARDQPIPGYTLNVCEEIGGNFLDAVVRWKGRDDLTALAGKPVKLYFKLRRAKLYAFQFNEK